VKDSNGLGTAGIEGGEKERPMFWQRGGRRQKISQMKKNKFAFSQRKKNTLLLYAKGGQIVHSPLRKRFEKKETVT